MKAVISALLISASLGGCAFIAQGQVNKYDRRVRSFESLEPDKEALGRGDTASTEHMLQQFEDWANYIDQQDLPAADRAKLVVRMDAAKRRYLLAAAQVTDTPDLGYALASLAIAGLDPSSLDVVRALADARAARRQRLFATTHTYSNVKDGETAVRTTSSAHFAGGKLQSENTRQQLEIKPGNCVFATQPFGPEGTPNPGLTFRLVGEHPKVFARCYLSQDLAGLPTRDGEFTISAPSLSTQIVPRPKGTGSQRTYDFVLDGAVTAEQPFAALTVSLDYAYTSDLVVVWEGGAQRLRKERSTYHLAQSPVFWDRDGLPTKTIARR